MSKYRKLTLEDNIYCSSCNWSGLIGDCAVGLIGDASFDTEAKAFFCPECSTELAFEGFVGIALTSGTVSPSQN